MNRTATLLAGVPLENPALFHRVRFSVGDPAAWLSFDLEGEQKTEFIVRDIEMDRARKQVAADKIACPADYTPAGGLSGDRATATAQAVAEALVQAQVRRVVTDRTLPFIYAWHIQQAGISLEYSPELGVLDRRVKDEQEIDWLAAAQKVTEEAMCMACQTVGRAKAGAGGALLHAGEPLTSERLQKMISEFLIERDFANPHGAIVATTPHSADCHERGSGPLVTGEAVIIDIFPQCNKTRYHGDCTRTVVHGNARDELTKMHAAVMAAKKQAIATTRVGVTADEIHGATKAELQRHGYRFERGAVSDQPVMPHGTGHGIGLEVHEPILLDDNGGTLLANEVLTIEPGLYSRQAGGVRVEDMVVVTEANAINLNHLPEGLRWD